MSANHTAGASRQVSQEELNVLDAAKAWSKWYERAVEGLSMETYDRETHSLWNIIRALVASEAKHDREAQVDEHRAFTPKASGSSPGPVIAAQGASDREAGGDWTCKRCGGPRYFNQMGCPRCHGEEEG